MSTIEVASFKYKIDYIEEAEEGGEIASIKNVMKNILNLMPKNYVSNYKLYNSYFSCLGYMIMKIPTFLLYFIKNNCLSELIEFKIYQYAKSESEKKNLYEYFASYQEFN